LQASLLSPLAPLALLALAPLWLAAAPLWLAAARLGAMLSAAAGVHSPLLSSPNNEMLWPPLH